MIVFLNGYINYKGWFSKNAEYTQFVILIVQQSMDAKVLR